MTNEELIAEARRMTSQKVWPTIESGDWVNMCNQLADALEASQKKLADNDWDSWY